MAKSKTKTIGPTDVQVVSIDSLVPRYASPEENPNKMEPEKYELLVKAMKEEGFLQPILVVPVEGKGKTDLVIDDGHHRWWGAKQAGYTHISIVIKKTDEHRARLLGIGMNRLRGELDLAQTADLIRVAQEHLALGMPEVSVLTGFTQEELAALLSVSPTSEEIMDEAADVVVDTDAPDAQFILEVPFSNRDEYKLVKRKLKKMGKGDLAVGLLTVLGEHEEE